ncbi:LETM1 and EF-hand domain-containing protein 1, mitochondrial [Sarotherodon galilaeus]
MALWRCMICFIFVSLTLKVLLSHINAAHGRRQDFWVYCGIDGCEQDFRVFNSFFRHIKRTHPLYLTNGSPPRGWRIPPTSHSLGSENFGVSVFANCSTTTTTSIVEISTGGSLPEVQEPQVVDSPITEEAVSTTSFTRHDITRSAAAFAISTTVKHIISGVQQYQAVLLDTLKERMKSVFEDHAEGTTQLQDDALATFDKFMDPFSTIAYGQSRAIGEMFCPVNAEEVVVSQKICWVKQGLSRVMSIRNKSFYYVPLIESLKQLMTNERIFTMLNTAPQRSREGFFYDFRDGSLFTSHPLFSQRPNALQLILYTDEIEICNPLGSHASANKLVMFYYTLGNIDPKFRSKLAAIRLLAIAKANDISQWGIDVVLKRILQDLSLLYNGVRIEMSNGEIELFGAVIAICGDTLAQHEIAGFKEGIGFAYSKCRHCECNFDDMQSVFEEKKFVQRTLEKHIRQCFEIDKASTDLLKASLKTTYGINRRSRIVDVPAFDLIKQTPQDIMHVIFEGVASMEVKFVLKHLILSGQLELDKFNSDIQNFPYSPLEIRDKPSPISFGTLAANDNKLKQSCGQMLILLKILLFLLYGVESEYVVFIRKLIMIVQIVLAPIISLQTVLQLRSMIEEHLYQFKQLFPEVNIIPKQHYMLHLPSQILSLGPLIRSMCMRFEAKHSYFKQWASKLNFKNVCKSLANHNQFLECCQNEIGTEHPIFAKEKESGPVSAVKNNDYVRKKIKEFFGIDVMQSVVSVKWYVLNGNKYITGKSMIIADVDGTFPVFGLIKDIFLIDSSFIAFEYQRYETLNLNEDLLAYEVTVPIVAQATELAHELIDYTSYFSISFRDSVFVPIKYSLSDIISHRNHP